MRSRNTHRFWIGLLGLALIAGCQTATPLPQATPVPQADPPTATATPAPTPSALPPTSTVAPEPETGGPEPTGTTEPVPLVSAYTWVPDGVISEGEYSQQADFRGIRLWWHNDETYLYLAMEGDTKGWVSVGIDPEQGMKGANYLFGYVENATARIWDAYGTARTGANHPPDEDLGGTNDIVAFAGVEENGVTRFEVQIPLDSGDAFDKPLEPGKSYPIIVAIGGADDFNGYHLKYAQGTLAVMATR